MEKNIILPPIPQDLMKSNLDLYNYLHALSKVLQEKQKADYKDNAVFQEVPLFNAPKSGSFGGRIQFAGQKDDSSTVTTIDTVINAIRFYEKEPYFQGAILNFNDCRGLCESEILASYESGISGSDGSRFIKLTNGIMLMWLSDNIVHTTLNNINVGTYGWSYYNGSAVKTLPASFVSASAYQVITCSVTWGGFVTAQKGDGDTITYFMYSPVSGTSSVNTFLIGRWK